MKWRNKSGITCEFSVANVWKDIRNEDIPVRWAKLIWFSQGIPRHAFILWLAVLKRLRTKDRVRNWSQNNDTCCILCLNEEESHDHVFVGCSYTQEIWEKIEEMGGSGGLARNIKNSNGSWDECVGSICNRSLNNSIWSVFQKLIFAAVVYFVWQERNCRIHQGQSRPVEVLAKQIYTIVKTRLLSLKVKNNSQTRKAAEAWGFRMGKDNFEACAGLT